VSSSSITSRSSSVTSPPTGFNLFLYSNPHYSCVWHKWTPQILLTYMHPDQLHWMLWWFPDLHNCAVGDSKL
jgi:hypothetical protein